MWEHVRQFKGLVVRFRGGDVGSALASAHGNELGQAAEALRHQSLRLNMDIEHEAPNKQFVGRIGCQMEGYLLRKKYQHCRFFFVDDSGLYSLCNLNPACP